MSDVRISTEDFATHVHSGDFRNAVAGMMGQNPKGIARSKNLLIEFEQLDSTHRESMLAWCRLPAEKLPVTNQRWYVEEIARHEMAHIVVAKAFGFSTGDTTLVLHSPDGSHQGTSAVNLDCPTTSLEEVSAYLDRRVIILLAGYIAESADASERKSRAYRAVQSMHAESDVQKARELIQVKLNIQGLTRPNAPDEMLRTLVRQASKIVEANFCVISALAQRFADRIEYYEQRIGWEGSEIDKEPEVQQISGPRGIDLAGFRG